MQWFDTICDLSFYTFAGALFLLLARKVKRTGRNVYSPVEYLVLFCTQDSNQKKALEDRLQQPERVISRFRTFSVIGWGSLLWGVVSFARLLFKAW